MIAFQLRPREYNQLDVLADRSHDATMVRRAHALLGLHEGLSAGEIAELLDVSQQTINNWTQAFQDRGKLNLTERLLDAPRCGRPVTVLGIIDPLIDAVIDDDPRDYGFRSTVWTASLLQRYLEVDNSWMLDLHEIYDRDSPGDEPTRSTPVDHGFYSRQEFACRSGFGHIAASPRSQCLVHNVPITILAHEDNFRSWYTLADASGSFNPI